MPVAKEKQEGESAMEIRNKRNKLPKAGGGINRGIGLAQLSTPEVQNQSITFNINITVKDNWLLHSGIIINNLI